MMDSPFTRCAPDEATGPSPQCEPYGNWEQSASGKPRTAHRRGSVKLLNLQILRTISVLGTYGGSVNVSRVATGHPVPTAPVADGSGEEGTVSEVRKVTIETVARGAVSMHHINANVNVGGSLVDVSCDSEGDSELQQLVDRLQDKLRALAIEAVNTSLHSS